MNIGRYEVRNLLGQGGMGQVYLGYDPTLRREVALKVMQLGAHSQEDMQRFQREATTVSSLNHTGIVTIYEMGQENGQLFMAMERVEGADFRQLLGTGAVPREAELRRNLLFFRQVLEAIAFAHEHGVVHRDLKPENIMITPDGQAKVLDFGLAYMAGNHNLTVTGAVGLGTPNYVAPEQIKDFAHTDARADVYSLGVILYELCTGQCPLQAANTVALIYKVISEVPAEPQTVNPGIGSELGRLIMRALAKDPDKRWNSASAMLQALDNACPGLEQEQKGTGLSAQAQSLGQKRTIVGIPIAAEASASCVYCGFANRPGFKFCSNCGRRALVCPSCGQAAQRAGAAFCASCGASLRPVAGTPAQSLLRGVLEKRELEEPQYEYLRFHRDYVRLGRYPQHEDSAAESIEWLVLCKDPDKRRMLLVSRYGLDCGRYFSDMRHYHDVVSWQDSTLRRWLDEDFLAQAFDQEERDMLIPVQFGAEDSLSFGRIRGDKVFLLSIAEAEKYFIDDYERCCQPTEYALSAGAQCNRPGQSDGYCWWWLRSAGTNEDSAACVHDGGAINDRGQAVWNTDLCIRPAVWVKV